MARMVVVFMDAFPCCCSSVTRGMRVAELQYAPTRAFCSACFNESASGWTRGCLAP